MEELKKNKILLIVFIVLIGILIYVLYYLNNDKNTNYSERNIPKITRYEANEFIPVNITYDQIARIYLQDYVYKLLYERKVAFEMLDSSYREAKFSSYEDFDKYVKDVLYSKKLLETIVVKYSVIDKVDYKDFDVYDSEENLFIFRETGVMQYTVFFDRYTIKM